MPDPASRVSALSFAAKGIRAIPSPPDGWLRTVRETLGLSRRAIGEKLGVTHAAVRDYELAELNDAITLATLRRMAGALGCDVVVALVPKDNRSFEELAATRPAAAETVAATAPSREAGPAHDELESHLK